MMTPPFPGTHLEEGGEGGVGDQARQGDPGQAPGSETIGGGLEQAQELEFISDAEEVWTGMVWI